MSASDWIICERTGRWAAAVRLGTARPASLSGREPRIYEVRSLEDLKERLVDCSGSLAMLEVHSSNLGNVLPWLAEASRKFPRVRFVALLDRALNEAGGPASKRSPDDKDVFIALLEAGAAEIAGSPRRLHHVLALAEKHFAVACEPRRPENRAQSIVDWAWSQLPWQTAR